MVEHIGFLRGEGRRFGIVIGRFNELITRQLLAGARDCLARHGVSDEDIEVAWVPGAWEIPGALRRLARAGRFDALLALGAVVRGGTPHFEYVAGQVASGVGSLGLELDIPVVFGVLTTDTVEQAIERAGTKAGNKGWDAAQAALEMADLYARLDDREDRGANP
jgi:6,7-dimethyl-8-ribityllumazine synthase